MNFQSNLHFPVVRVVVDEVGTVLFLSVIVMRGDSHVSAFLVLPVFPNPGAGLGEDWFRVLTAHLNKFPAALIVCGVYLGLGRIRL